MNIDCSLMKGKSCSVKVGIVDRGYKLYLELALFFILCLFHVISFHVSFDCLVLPPHILVLKDIFIFSFLIYVTGLFNVSEKALASYDILFEFREFFKRGQPISNVICAKRTSLKLKSSVIRIFFMLDYAETLSCQARKNPKSTAPFPRLVV